ncbi:hypothetical protein KSP40_PGU006960 [Platanthera guangdongensis]|uniref:Uncharacterized protein n=1 Tax=Platanthera guangdongensis TaxID=2320717 RepID=A0ABR2LM68_9ASPA
MKRARSEEKIGQSLNRKVEHVQSDEGWRGLEVRLEAYMKEEVAGLKNFCEAWFKTLQNECKPSSSSVPITQLSQPTSTLEYIIVPKTQMSSPEVIRVSPSRVKKVICKRALNIHETDPKYPGRLLLTERARESVDFVLSKFVDRFSDSLRGSRISGLGGLPPGRWCFLGAGWIRVRCLLCGLYGACRCSTWIERAGCERLKGECFDSYSLTRNGERKIDDILAMFDRVVAVVNAWVKPLFVEDRLTSIIRLSIKVDEVLWRDLNSEEEPELSASLFFTMRAAILTRTGSISAFSEISARSPRSPTGVNDAGVPFLRRRRSMGLSLDIKQKIDSPLLSAKPNTPRRVRSEADLTISTPPSPYGTSWLPPARFTEVEKDDLVAVTEVDFSGGGKGSGANTVAGSGGDGRERGDRGLGSYYLEMLKADPGNSLLLRNYGRFLHEVEGDLQKADYYYSRAILATPDDGELLSLYGRYVMGSYAHFLWEAEEEDEEVVRVSSSPPLVEAI